MRFSSLVTIVLLVPAAVWAAENPQLTAARERVKKLELLVRMGAASRSQLAQAQAEVADAEDEEVVTAGLRNRDSTEAQAQDMVAAAARMLARKQAAFDQAKKLVDGGLDSKANLTLLGADLDFARKEFDLAQEVATVTARLAIMAQSEAALPPVPTGSAVPGPAESGVTESYDGDSRFNPEILARLESAFQRQFGKLLPISAMGETAVHRTLGFDHTGRVDVAVAPDQPEGVWLREYLRENRIPYFAFRHAVPGKATGAHIHLGPQSTRLARARIPSAAGPAPSAE